MRDGGRAAEQIRDLTFERGFTDNPYGSVLVRWGRTHVLCTVSIEESVPGFLLGKGRGWLTAEYAMLPGSTRGRKPRDIARLRVDGRSGEIQRLIGRSLRAGVDLERCGERTFWIDCDVLQADGGTRCASISGAWVALRDAVDRALADGLLAADPIVHQVTALSVGVVEGVPLVDLCAAEDQRADVDMNLVSTASGDYIEVQGSAERGTLPADGLSELLRLGREGARQVAERQLAALQPA